ncbi:MAG: hypothetical protein PW788_11420 [Micavibrio sp.]|nr:hypothetical protein [Micavibrio sp.]
MSDNQLSQHQIESRKEIVIPITLKGLAQGYAKLAYEKPVNLYKWVATKFDNLAIHKNMRNGHLAAITLPLGIMLRNGTRAAHNLADGKYLKGVSQWLGGTVGAGGAWFVAGKALAATLTSNVPLLATVGGKIATTAVAAALSFPVVVPAFMVGTLAMATAVGLGITALSALPAVLNIKTGILRSLDRIKGIKGVNYDDPAAEAEITHNSLSSRRDRQQYSEVVNGLRYLSEEGQKGIYESLKGKFEKAANQNAPQQQQQPAPVAQAAAKTSSKPTP